MRAPKMLVSLDRMAHDDVFLGESAVHGLREPVLWAAGGAQQEVARTRSEAPQLCDLSPLSITRSPVFVDSHPSTSSMEN
eukprot:3942117-Amphidinium_carterae.1